MQSDQISLHFSVSRKLCILSYPKKADQSDLNLHLVHMFEGTFSDIAVRFINLVCVNDPVGVDK